ncbi:hypothetical protein [Streptomyces sp. NPDC101149]|uniref:hypothetical protein n=1 Tax=Streptomyces sp. NPDC101149 TaxID=3366113 RepID=UPI00380E837E
MRSTERDELAGKGGTVPRAARLHLADGVPLLRPGEQVFEAMLDGWRNQQLARNLALSTGYARSAASRWCLASQRCAYTARIPSGPAFRASVAIFG